MDIDNLILIEDNVICEIKPYTMLTMKLNVLKFKSLEEYCKQYNLKCKYITENTYDISKYNLSYILDFIEKN